jgi:hypothetical protein
MSTETTQNVGLTVKKTGELASSASAAQARALVEAKFTMAIHRPRSILQARAAILDACKRPRFAESAWYAKPVGKKNGQQQFVYGPSIRFAEEAIRAMTNVAVMPTILHEDDDKRIIHIDVIDLESNTSYGDTVTITKTIERKDSRGREVISERTNSWGDKVFIVVATEDEIALKMNSAKSKIIRNSGLRLIPQDIIEEAEEQVQKTLNEGGEDPKAAAKKVVDSFGTIGVKPADLEAFLGHSVESCAPHEMKTLRGIFAAIRDGEAKWVDYTQRDVTPKDSTTAPPVFDKSKQGKGKKQPEPPTDHGGFADHDLMTDEKPEGHEAGEEVAK